MNKRKTYTLLGVLGVLTVMVIIGFAASYMFMGTPVYNTEDYYAISAKNSAGSAVTLSNVYKKSGYLWFTPAASYSELQITFDFLLSDFKDSGIRQITVDTKNLEVVAGTSWDKIKIYIGDGTNWLYLGSQTDLGASSFMCTYEDVKETLSLTAKAIIRLIAVNSSGSAVNLFDAKAQSVAAEFTMGGGYQSVTALVASGIIAMIVAFKRAVAGITSALGAAVAAISTNEVIITVIVAIGILIAFAYFVPRKVRRY